MIGNVVIDIGDWGTFGAAIVAAIALTFAWLQVKGLRDQTALAAQAGVSQAYGEGIRGMTFIHKIFLANPGWIPYFYDGHKAPKANSKKRAQLEYVCEILMDFLDTVVEQRNAMPSSDMDWSTWETYFRGVYASSPIMREWAKANIDHYPDYEFAVLGFIIVRDPLYGKVLSHWSAVEIDTDGEPDSEVAQRLQVDEIGIASESRYPWLRAWMIERVLPESGPKVEVVVSVRLRTRRHADVKLRWLSAYDHQASEVLSSWILGILGSSALIEQATLTTDVVGMTNGIATYELRSAKQKRREKSKRRERGDRRHLEPQEPFLVPRFLPDRGRTVGNLTPRNVQGD